MCVFDLTMNHTVLLLAISVNLVSMKMFVIFQGHCEFLAFGLSPQSSKQLDVLDFWVFMCWALDYDKGQEKWRGKG